MSEIVLVAVHDSAAAFAAAETGVDLARRLGAAVHAVEVVETAEGAPGAGGAPAMADGALRHLARAAASAGVAFTSERRHGPVAPAVLEAAKAVGADLIVMARVDRPGHTIPGIGSRTLRVIEFAEVPVVVVPAPVA